MRSICFFFIFIVTIQFAWSSPIKSQVDEGISRLEEIHSKLTLIHGKLTREYDEQLMSAIFLPPDAKVLELGANIGRNSCVIGTILNNSENLVTMESSKKTAKLLKENRDLNHLQFHIEASAISKVPLIQKGWVTIPSEIDLPGYSRVNTLSFNEVQEKYGIIFDTLVVDCEGALFYILRDDPKILENIKLIIIENDYDDIQHYEYVVDTFIKNGFKLVYNKAHSNKICKENFYQTWKK